MKLLSTLLLILGAPFAVAESAAEREFQVDRAGIDEEYLEEYPGDEEYWVERERYIQSLEDRLARIEEEEAERQQALKRLLEDPDAN